MSRNKIEKIAEKLSDYFGEPFNAKQNPPAILDVLIATKLSQNTTDKSSFKAYKNLRKKYSTWEKVSKADTEQIKECIKICGLSDTKARNIKEMLVKMKRNYGNLDLRFLHEYTNEEVYTELLQYAGLGKKTISCVLIFAMGRDAFPVDTHVHRILNRLGIVKTNTPEKTYEKADIIIPEGKKYELHSNLIKFGRNICTAKNPLCNICFLYKECMFDEKKIHRKNQIKENAANNNFIILENI